jgi:predicted amidohydrolase YtcJ
VRGYTFSSPHDGDKFTDNHCHATNFGLAEVPQWLQQQCDSGSSTYAPVQRWRQRQPENMLHGNNNAVPGTIR